MIIDKQNEFSDAQAVTASAASANVIKCDESDLGLGMPVRVFAQVQTDFAGATSLAVSLQQDDDEEFGTVETLWTSGAVAVADLTAGYAFALPPLPSIDKDYIRLYYTVADGPFTGGKIDAALVLDDQTAAGERDW